MPDKKIVGNIVGLPSPRSDWNQTDEKKADFIKNKPDIVSQSEFEELKKWLEQNGADLVRFIPTINILYEALSQNAENTKNIISAGGFAVGYNNNVNKCSLAVGLQNIITGYRSFGSGQGLNAYGESNRAYFGQFNAKNGQAVLTVGWGTSDSNRKNIFTVDKTGKGVFAGDVYANGQRLAGVGEVTSMIGDATSDIAEFKQEVSDFHTSVISTFSDIRNVEIVELRDAIAYQRSIIDSMKSQIDALQSKIDELTN